MGRTILSPLDRLVCHKWRAPKSGQIWLEIHRDDKSVTLIPEYPSTRNDQVTLTLEYFRELKWEKVQ